MVKTSHGPQYAHGMRVTGFGTDIYFTVGMEQHVRMQKTSAVDQMD